MIKIKRKLKYKTYYHPKMGYLTVPVVEIYKSIMGLKVKMLHKYRETYFGEIKEIKNCRLSKI